MRNFYQLSAPQARKLAARAIPVGNVIVVDDDARVLLGRRHAESIYEAGKWNLPGGRCEAGEDYATAALRELHEEFGLVLEAAALRPLGGYCCEYDDRIVNAFYHGARVRSGNAIRIARDEFCEGGFHPLAEVARWDLAFEQQRVIRLHVAALQSLVHRCARELVV